MLAGHLVSPRRIELADIPEPVLPASEAEPGMVLFQPETTCLCGSDLPFFDGDFEGHAIEYPQPIGMSLHEMVGTVIATNGTKWKPGERVLAVPVGQQGLFERFVLKEDRIVALQPGMTDEMCMLAQPFGTVIHALRKLPSLIDADVVVLGQGPIGQLFNCGLRNLGARNVIGIDPVDSRLRLSRTMGATSVVCARGVDAVLEVQRSLSGKSADIVIEAVGHRAQALNDAIALAGNEGTVMVFGVPPHTIDGVELRAAMWKNLTIRTSLHPDFERTYPLAMQWIRERRVDLRPLITHRFPLTDIQRAFDTFRDRTDGACKVVIEFPSLQKALG